MRLIKKNQFFLKTTRVAKILDFFLKILKEFDSNLTNLLLIVSKTSFVAKEELFTSITRSNIRVSFTNLFIDDLSSFSNKILDISLELLDLSFAK